jgi:hypothetical protein
VSIFKLEGHMGGFSIPKPPADIPSRTSTTGRWVPKGESIEFRGRLLPDGMIYVGTDLWSDFGGIEPALLNPNLKIDWLSVPSQETVGFHGHLEDSPSWGGLTMRERALYLLWLADGRKDPGVPLRFVKLFYFGLERRILRDIRLEPALKSELPGLKEEIARLNRIYGARLEAAHRGAATMTGMLEFLEVRDATGKFYEREFTVPKGSKKCPLLVRVALGQAAVDGVPIPPRLALARHQWEMGVLHSSLAEHPELFAESFLHHYSEMHGEGMMLEPIGPSIQLSCMPMSPTLFPSAMVLEGVVNLPDVHLSSDAREQFRMIEKLCAKDLTPYIKLISSNPQSAGTMQATLRLPLLYWPEAAKSKFAEIVARVIPDDCVALKISDIREWLGLEGPWDQPEFKALCALLSSGGLCAEPDALRGDKLPTPDGVIVVYPGPPTQDITVGSRYPEVASLLALLGQVVRGDLTDERRRAAFQRIDTWTDMLSTHRQRLKAVFVAASMNAVSFKANAKKLTALPSDKRATYGRLLVSIACVGGPPALYRIKLLEKIYKALGLETQSLYADMHLAATGASMGLTSINTAAPLDSPKAPLDQSRIAALQEDSARVQSLLSDVFAEDEQPETPAAPSTEPLKNATTASEAPPESIIGLDAKHSAFARQLMSQLTWPRSDLLQRASSLDLMLDGAIECINDACFDLFDVPLCEGEDPIEISPEIISKLGLHDADAPSTTSPSAPLPPIPPHQADLF